MLNTQGDLEPLLDVRDLSTSVFSPSGEGKYLVVDRVSFSVSAGRTLGIVGESASGKTLTCLSLLKLIPRYVGAVESGSVHLRGVGDLLSFNEKALRRVRGSKVGMIFQDPMTSLNPSYTVGFQLSETIRLHARIRSRALVQEYAEELLAKVGIPYPKEKLSSFPYALSGGMRQRVVIAMAIACHPSLLLADEPTTALDVTTQAQILQLLDDLQTSHKMSIILITHDMAVVGESTDFVAVFYSGQIVEYGKTDEVLKDPRHPYTQALLKSIPSHPKNPASSQPLHVISGSIPRPGSIQSGCRFAPRCPYVMDACREASPPKEYLTAEHWASCLVANR